MTPTTQNDESPPRPYPVDFQLATQMSSPHPPKPQPPPSPPHRRHRPFVLDPLSSRWSPQAIGDRRRQVTGSVLPLAALTPLPNSPGCFFSGPDKFCAAVPTEDLTTATEQLTHGRQKQCRAVRRLRPPLVIKNPTAAAIVTSARRGKRQRRHCLRGIPPPTSDRYQGKV